MPSHHGPWACAPLLLLLCSAPLAASFRYQYNLSSTREATSKNWTASLSVGDVSGSMIVSDRVYLGEVKTRLNSFQFNLISKDHRPGLLGGLDGVLGLVPDAQEEKDFMSCLGQKGIRKYGISLPSWEEWSAWHDEPSKPTPFGFFQYMGYDTSHFNEPEWVHNSCAAEGCPAQVKVKQVQLIVGENTTDLFDFSHPDAPSHLDAAVDSVSESILLPSNLHGVVKGLAPAQVFERAWREHVTGRPVAKTAVLRVILPEMNIDIPFSALVGNSQDANGVEPMSTVRGNKNRFVLGLPLFRAVNVVFWIHEQRLAKIGFATRKDHVTSSSSRMLHMQPSGAFARWSIPLVVGDPLQSNVSVIVDTQVSQLYLVDGVYGGEVSSLPHLAKFWQVAVFMLLICPVAIAFMLHMLQAKPRLVVEVEEEELQPMRALSDDEPSADSPRHTPSSLQTRRI